MTTSPSTQTTQDSWESRVQTAAQIMGITAEDVEAGLASDEIGIENGPLGLSMLSDENILRFADFSKVFKDGKGIKMGRVRLAYNKLIKPNGETEKATSLDPRTLELKEKFGYKTKLADARSEDLLKYYKASDPNDPVTRALQLRYGNIPVIALDPETGEVAIAESLDVMTDIERGIEPPTMVSVNGTLVHLVPVGVQPDIEMDEDPLYPGQPLRRNRSDGNYANWEGVDVEARQLCRIIYEKNQIDRNDRLALAKFMEIAKSGFKALKEIYPEAELAFRERKKIGDLPRLKMLVNRSGRKQNPFGVGGKNNRVY